MRKMHDIQFNRADPYHEITTWARTINGQWRNTTIYDLYRQVNATTANTNTIWWPARRYEIRQR